MEFLAIFISIAVGFLVWMMLTKALRARGASEWFVKIVGGLTTAAVFSLVFTVAMTIALVDSPNDQPSGQLEQKIAVSNAPASTSSVPVPTSSNVEVVGFRPSDACQFLGSMLPNPPDKPDYNAYSPEVGSQEDYMCVRDEIDAGWREGPTGLRNRINYYAEGSRSSVNHLQLTLEVFNPADVHSALPLLKTGVASLYKSVFDEALPSEISQKITNRTLFKTSKKGIVLSLSKEMFDSHFGGYRLSFDIRTP